jgi:DnaK suppressor protein
MAVKKKAAKKKTGKAAPARAAKKAVPAKAAKAAPKKSAAPRRAAKPAVAVKKALKKPSKAAPAKPGKATSQRHRKILEIRVKLVGQKSGLLAEAESAMNALPDQTIFPDLGDQASLETDRGFLLRLKGREQRLLLKIEEALERIDRGAYGICEVCGEEIAIQRLEARPVTTMCIDCKTEQEADEKLQGS